MPVDIVNSMRIISHLMINHTHNIARNSVVGFGKAGLSCLMNCSSCLGPNGDNRNCTSSCTSGCTSLSERPDWVGHGPVFRKRNIEQITM